MTTLVRLLPAFLVLSTASVAAAQSTANPFTTMLTASWDDLKKSLVASAAVLPEADYGFKPTPDVRSFGQIIGHLANDHSSQHYGNLITYLRLKGRVPPSSTGGQ